MYIKAGNEARLSFFGKDPVEWREHSMSDYRRRLIALKKANSELWNGRWGAGMIQVVNSAPTTTGLSRFSTFQRSRGR